MLLEEEDLGRKLEGRQECIFAASGVCRRDGVTSVCSQGGLRPVFDRGVLPRGHLPVFVTAFAVSALLCGETMEASPSAMRLLRGVEASLGDCSPGVENESRGDASGRVKLSESRWDLGVDWGVVWPSEGSRPADEVDNA